MATRLDAPPLWLAGAAPGAEAALLEPIPLGRGAEADRYNEAWLQDVLFAHPELIPHRVLDRDLPPAIPVCKELPVQLPDGVGYVDLLAVTPTGTPVLVECKLWRNPEAKREVVAQVIDYAAGLTGGDFESLDSAVRLACRGEGLLDRVRARSASVDEEILIDGITTSMADGNFVLLVVGDGIRSGVQSMFDYLGRFPGHRWRLGLVELAVYRMPAKSAAGGLVMVPRLVMDVVPVERAVVRIDGGAPLGGVRVTEGAAGADIAEAQSTSTAARRPRLSEEELLDLIETAVPGCRPGLESFLTGVRDLGLNVVARRSLTLHWHHPSIGNANFGSIYMDGTLETSYLCETAEKAGNLSIGTGYLKGLAAMIPGARADLDPGRAKWTWRVTVGRQAPSISPLIEQADSWLGLIRSTISRFEDQLGPA
ncbi:MAG: hypothetical protein RIC85_05040 [Gammaproteobacteria bacterium]|uniref:hypothetical protein n=1 Tax=Thalassobaculum sp. TaxID=2022740 RepID=UPI0032ED072D